MADKRQPIRVYDFFEKKRGNEGPVLHATVVLSAV